MTPLTPLLDTSELRPMLGSRALFPDLRPLVYVNHAGISPVSIAVKRAVTTLLGDYAKRGADAYFTWSQQRKRLKCKLAELIGAHESEVALTHNTSRGLFDAAMSLPWQRGDRVVVFRGEFPANVIPWQQAAGIFGLELVWLDADNFRTEPERALDELDRTCEAQVAACAVSAVEFQTGFLMPVVEISRRIHQAGGVLVVDAVQACGAVPIHVGAMGIDYLACGSHKWLLGIEGGGFVYCGRALAERLAPRTAGWLSFEGSTDFLFDGPGQLRYDRPVRRQIDYLEGANLSASAFVAMEASLDIIRELGVESIYDHVCKYGDALENQGKQLGYVSLRSSQGKSGSVCFRAPQGVDVVAVHRRLGELGVACALPDGNLRFSPHFSNALDEVDQVALSLKQALVDSSL